VGTIAGVATKAAKALRGVEDLSKAASEAEKVEDAAKPPIDDLAKEPVPGVVVAAATGSTGLVDEAAALQAARTELARTTNLRARQRYLGTDPKRGYIEAEGIAGLRIEQALGRQITRSSDPAMDFIDSALGPISLKGPIPANGSVEGLGNAVIRDAMGGNTATRTVIVDTLGLSSEQFQALQAAIAKGTVNTSKSIIYIR
jgi:hypothetical protein